MYKKILVYFLVICVAAVSLLALLKVSLSILNKKRPNIVVLLLDTLRADHLSIYGHSRNTTPNLDKFGRENAVYLNVMSAAPWTPPSVASIFTGLYPASHRMMPPASRKKAVKTSRGLSSHVHTMAEIFKAAGYYTASVSSNPWIGPEFGYQQGFDSFVHISRAKAEEVNNEAFKTLDARKDKSDPFLLYLHYLDPHDPYKPPPEFKALYENAEPLKYGDDQIYADEMQELLKLYDGEISYLDHHLEMLFQRLKSDGLYDDAVIVIVGDHGEQFMEHGRQGHGYYLYNDELHVPLLVKAPDKRSVVNSDTVSTVDIFPTLLELSGLKIPNHLPGVSLFNDSAIRSRSGVVSEIDHKVNQRAFTDPAGRKIIIDCGKSQNRGGTGENCDKIVGVFDRSGDSLELKPITDEKIQELLRSKLSAEFDKAKSIQIESGGEEVNIPDKTLEDLKSLGYF